MGDCPPPLGPTLAGFLAYPADIVQVPSSALPAGSPYPQAAYCNALEIVNRAIQTASCLIYTEAVYALATSNLLNFCPDQSGQTFFGAIREKWNLNSFIGGVIGSTGDEGTSESMVVPDYFRLFTIADLQYLKDPYGRRYLGYAMRYGTLWGLS